MKFSMISLFVLLVCCTPQAASVATGVTITIAQDLCSEVDSSDAGAPEWVTLICKTIDGKETVKVIIPRAQWVLVKAGKK